MIYLIIILVILFVVALFYRPVGTGYSSYSQAGILLVIVLILLLLYLLGVVRF